MLKELKKINRIGNRDDVTYFINSVIGKKTLTKADICKISNYSPGNYLLDVEALLIYCAYLELIIYENEIIYSPVVEEIINNEEKLNNFIIETTVKKLFNDNIFGIDMFTYSSFYNIFVFRNEKFSLDYSALRNILISQGFFVVNTFNNNFQITIKEHYEPLIAKFIEKKKKIITIDEFKLLTIKNEEAGEKAELYALEYERKRITNLELQKKIKRISNIDVGAGYDIISFNDNNESSHNRFIEVKAVAKSHSFFWSKNECDFAKLKGDQYYLYLVELNNISNSDYHPYVVCNPANRILNSNDWLVEPHSFHICNINALE